ncbi:hypothetical protein ACO0QE_002619 [Hanseniaspora vineae]
MSFYENSNGSGSTLSVNKSTRSVIIEDGSTLKYNDRVLWPQIIKEPANQWTYSTTQILDKLNSSGNVAATKKKIERSLLLFYKMKAALNLQEPTYIAACILFYRFWMTFDLPDDMNDCMDLALSALVTACKISENNRPIRAYVDAAVNILNSGLPINQQKLEKIKWRVRDRFSANEMKFLSMMNFDFDICNPRHFIEEVFSVQYRLSRDKYFPKDFEAVFPSILKEARVFIYQTEAQPVSLLCDGIVYIQYALVFAALQYKKKGHPDFKFPKNFFSKRFPNSFDPLIISELANSHYKLEKNFLKMGSNKGILLLMTTDDIREITEEEVEEVSGVDVESQPHISELQDKNNETSEGVSSLVEQKTKMAHEEKDETKSITESPANDLKTSQNDQRTALDKNQKEPLEPPRKKQCFENAEQSISDFYYLDVEEGVSEDFLKYTEERIQKLYDEEFKKSNLSGSSTPVPPASNTISRAS